MTSVLAYRPTPEPVYQAYTPVPSSPTPSQKRTKYPNTPPLPSLTQQSPRNMPSTRPHTAGAGSSQPFQEFGAYNQHASTSAATTSAATRSKTVQPIQPSQPISIPIPEQRDAAATTAHRQRVRQSHNPSSALPNASPPKPEYLTDEYVLHPSVWSYKQAHPRRPMIGFGPYVLLQTLGEGEFGKVKLGVHTEFGVEVAIKLIRRGSLDDEARASKVEREIDVLKTLKHPNIVRMFDVIDTEKYIGIVLEFAGGGELFDYILANRYLKERDAQKLFAQLISGVDYLHKKHIVHRDLKLENLLLDKHRNIIITDFGFANRFDHEQDDLMATSCGSPCYAAPELVVSEGLYVGSAVDIWSCGVILYAMLAGYLPYDDDPTNPDGDNINLLYKYIMSTKLNFPEHMTPAARNLLQIMLVPDPEHRCRIEHIMQHPWLAGHRDQFERSVEDHEYIFQESMYRKSQTAKRELAERRKVQVDGKQAKLAIARSQSSIPGTTVTASMLDQTRRQNRHHSAMPNTTTMPEHLNRAAQAPASLPISASTRQSLPIPAPTPSAAQTSSVNFDAPIMSPSAQSAAATVAHTQSAVSNTAPVEPTKVPIAPAVDESSMDVDRKELDTADPAKAESSRPPMSSNKNRHTIQVEYDGEASYEKMKEILDAKRAAAASSGASIPVMPSSQAPSPRLPIEMSQAVSDVEMESASSDQGHTQEGTMESAMAAGSDVATPDASQLLTPVGHTPPTTAILEATAEEPTLEIPAIPTTPSKKGKETATPQNPSTPLTPRGPKQDQPDDMMTPRPHKTKPAVLTPRSAGKRADSMPSKTSTPRQSSQSIPVPPIHPSLKPSGLPKAPSPRRERDRYRKGMSLDKFGLAKLLGQAHASSSSMDVRGPPPSASSSAAAEIQARENGDLSRSTSYRSKRGSMSRPRYGENDPKSEKKTRRRTLQLMSTKKPSQDVKSVPAAPATAKEPLAPRDLNPAPSGPRSSATASGKLQTSPVVQSEGIQPNPGQSSPSIVTVDAFTAQHTSSPPNKTASSSAAKKVMDWFRKKSIAKETLTSLKQAGVKSDSASSFVKVSDSPLRSRNPHEGAKIGSSANLAAMSSTSSIAQTAEDEAGPSDPTSEAIPDSATLPKTSQADQSHTELPLPPPITVPVAPPAASQSSSGALTPTRIPLASAANKTNIETQANSSSTPTLLPSSRSSLPLPSRSKSHMPEPSSSNARHSPVLQALQQQSSSNAKSTPRSTSMASIRQDEAKMRVHTGLVDQSALSSMPPSDVILEVIRVLQEMGMDIKKENDFKLRCTRARRKKAGPTTGLGLGSVMSVGSGMGSFSLMGPASTNKTDSRGLPLPTSPSTGSGGILSSASGGLKGMLLRRGSSYSAASPLSRAESDILGSPSASTIGFGSPIPGSPTIKEPLYGEHSVDNGDEVKFVIELCRIKNLPGLYLLNIKRLRGSVWSFKFIYQTVIERCETLTH